MRTNLLIAGVFLIGACLQTLAGYRSVTANEAKPSLSNEKGIITTVSWAATVFREDGRIVLLNNLGDRFASQTLMRNEKIEICLVIPGVKPGNKIHIASTHGGKIEDRHRTDREATEDGQFCFPYTMGTMGAHPVILTVNGKSVTFIFLVEEELQTRTRDNADKVSQGGVE